MAYRRNFQPLPLTLESVSSRLTDLSFTVANLVQVVGENRREFDGSRTGANLRFVDSERRLQQCEATSKELKDQIQRNFELQYGCCVDLNREIRANDDKIEAISEKLDEKVQNLENFACVGGRVGSSSKNTLSASTVWETT